jgi:hypothetical protein
MRTLCQVLGLAFVLLLAPLAKADTLDFTLIGAGSTYTFSIDSSPTPDSFVNNEYFQLNNVLVNINGIFGQSSEVRFFNSADDGGLIFLDIPNLGATGDQLYTGTEASPTFRTGTFNLLRLNTTPFTLTIAPETSPVPEPGTFVLLGTGAVAALGSLRRRVAHS